MACDSNLPAMCTFDISRCAPNYSVSRQIRAYVAQYTQYYKSYGTKCENGNVRENGNKHIDQKYVGENEIGCQQ